MHGYKGEEKDFFTYIEKDMTNAPTGILTLPYFGGAATPYSDVNAKGAVLNLTTQTSDSNLYKSVMEGTAMEMRLNAEAVGRYEINVENVVATGGGANSEKWLQLKADIQNIPVKTLRSSEGGLCGCAMLQAVALGGAKDLEEAKEIFVRYAKEFVPNAESTAAYETQYQKYKKIYKTLKEFM
jgi:xylulokinase